MEQEVIIRDNDLLFHISDLPFHLLKIIPYSKQWKGALKRHSHNANSVNRQLVCFLFSIEVPGELDLLFSLV